MEQNTSPRTILGHQIPSWISASRGLSLAVKTGLALGALTAIIVSSATLYGLFYNLYVPSKLHTMPIYFDYTASPAAATALVEFVPESAYKFLSSTQAYAVGVELTLPTSERNTDLGNFMVSVDLRARTGQSLVKAARPTTLTYRSGMVRFMHLARDLVPLFLGVSRESEVVDVIVFDEVYDHFEAPITAAHIALAKAPQVYEARVYVMANFSGLRYWMYHWRTLTAVIFVAIAILWQAVFTAVAWSVLESYTRARETEGREAADSQGQIKDKKRE